MESGGQIRPQPGSVQGYHLRRRAIADLAVQEANVVKAGDASANAQTPGSVFRLVHDGDVKVLGEQPDSVLQSGRCCPAGSAAGSFHARICA